MIIVIIILLIVLCWLKIKMDSSFIQECPHYEPTHILDMNLPIIAQPQPVRQTDVDLAPEEIVSPGNLDAAMAPTVKLKRANIQLTNGSDMEAEPM